MIKNIIKFIENLGKILFLLLLVLILVFCVINIGIVINLDSIY